MPHQLYCERYTEKSVNIDGLKKLIPSCYLCIIKFLSSLFFMQTGLLRVQIFFTQMDVTENSLMNYYNSL